MNVENKMRTPIENDSRGKSAVVDEASDGSKAIPITIVYKTSSGFEHEGAPTKGTNVENEMSSPVEIDSRGNAEVVDEDVNGMKAIPLVPVAKNADGVFEYVELGGGGGEIEVTWSDIQGKPSTFPPAAHNHDTLYAAIDHNHDDKYYSKAEVDALIDALRDELTTES